MYIGEDARAVWNGMCSHHRGIDNHQCRNPAACAFRGEVAAWLEQVIILDSNRLKLLRNRCAGRTGELWHRVSNTMQFSIDGIGGWV
jgi:hypothetical protein